jgi:mRNA interferase MazF
VNRGAIVEVDFGTPIGSEAGFRRPGVVMIASAFAQFRPSTVFVVPLTTTRRDFPSHVEIVADRRSGLDVVSYALVEQMRAVSAARCGDARGHVSAVEMRQMLEVLSMIVGM